MPHFLLLPFLLKILFTNSLLIQGRIEEMHTGSTNQVELSREEVLRTSIPLPPPNEQRRIVAKLDRLFARSRSAREELERIPKLCDRYKQVVLSAATLGQLTEEWRQNNNCLIWERKSLGDVASIIDPHPSHRTPEESQDGIPYVGIGDLDQSGNFDFVNARKVSKDILKEHRERYALNEGDFIFGKIGTLGKATRLPLAYEYTLSANVILIQPDVNLIEPRYLMFFLQAPETLNEIASQSNSTSQAAFGIKKMRALKFLLPNLREQTEIISRVEKLFKAIDLMGQEYQKASKLCDRLEQATLSKAFRGELVPQDPDDEPASALLERILAEKQDQPTSKRGRVKKTG